MTTNAKTPAYLIGSCGSKHVTRYTAAEWAAARIDGGSSSAKYGYAPCGACGYMVTVRAIRCTVTRTECGPRCTSALGPSCDCKCSGENHGADHGHGARTVEIPVAPAGPVDFRQLTIDPATPDEDGAQLDLFEAVAAELELAGGAA